MTRSDPDRFVIIRSDGKRSKPATRQQVSAAYSNGELSDTDQVMSLHTKCKQSLEEFIGESEFLSIATNGSNQLTDQTEGGTKTGRVATVSMGHHTSGITIHPGLLLGIVCVSILFGYTVNRFLPASGPLQVGPLERGNLAGPLVANAAIPDTQEKLAKVRAFLRESTNTGHWEEVRIWHPLILDEDDWYVVTHVRRQYEIAQSEGPNLELMEAVTQLRSDYKSLTNSCLLRMKYRTPNAVGATVLQDVVFVVSDEGVFSSGMDDVLAWGWDLLESHPVLTQQQREDIERASFGYDTPMGRMWEVFLPGQPQERQE